METFEVVFTVRVHSDQTRRWFKAPFNAVHAVQLWAEAIQLEPTNLVVITRYRVREA